MYPVKPEKILKLKEGLCYLYSQEKLILSIKQESGQF